MGTQAATLQRKPVIQSATRAPVATVMRSPAKHVTAAVPAYLQKSRIQRAQTISQPHDPAEREAEATAKAVVSMNVPATASAPGTGIQRASEGQTAVAPAIPQGISANLSGGMPLPPKVRTFMEPRFRANFGAVRIHTGEKAANLSRQLSARAFTVGNDIFFGQGEFQPESLAGMELLAHELTHTIQQGATVQASEATPAVTQAAPRKLQRLGISDILDYFADKANNIPGYRMFTIILGFNPINMSDVDRSGANILRALIEFLPGGKLITDALEKYGVFTKAGAWIDTQFKKLGNIGSAIRNAISEFIDSLGWRDIFRLGRVWDRAKRIFTDPIDRIIDFGKGLVDGIITLIKDAILMPLAKLAEGTRGWDLLCAVLGKNPITGEKVAQSAENLVGGFMKFIGQEEVWKRILATGAIGKVWAWFKNALATLINFVTQLPALALAAFRSLELTDIIVLPRAIIKIVKVFGNFAMRFVNWALDAVWNLLEIVFSVVSPGAWGYIKRTGAALKSILKNPLPFVGNLAKSAKGGFQKFSDRFDVHLKAGLIDWLTGSLPGIYIPKAFELTEIAKFAMSALGLSWANIRLKLVKAIGETAVKVLETGFDIVVTLVRDGPAAAWEKIKEQLVNLKDMVIGGITSFVVETVVQKAIPKLVAMFIPGAGFISAIISIYDMVMVIVNKIATIIQVVTGFIDSITAIAAGAIATAVNKVEGVLGALVKLAINFLAGFAGLGKVADKIMGVLERVRAPIDKALDWLVNWIVTAAKKLGKMIAQAGVPQDPNERLKLGLDLATRAVNALRGNSVSGALIDPVLSGIKTRYGFAYLRPVEQGGDWWIEGEINPKGRNKTNKKKLTEADGQDGQTEKHMRPKVLIGKSTPNLDSLAQIPRESARNVHEVYAIAYANLSNKDFYDNDIVQYVEARAARKLGRYDEGPAIAAFVASSGIQTSQNRKIVLIGRTTRTGQPAFDSNSPRRIPDFLTSGNVVGDVKRTKTISLDQQLQDDLTIANGNQAKFEGTDELLPQCVYGAHLIVRGPSDELENGTHVSSNLKNQFNSSGKGRKHVWPLLK